MLAPKLAITISDIWAISWKERRIANALCLGVVLLYSALVHLTIAIMFEQLASKHNPSLRPGKTWALFGMIGFASYCLVPGIERRIRWYFKK
jgi:hypothetical protein